MLGGRAWYTTFSSTSLVHRWWLKNQRLPIAPCLRTTPPSASTWKRSLISRTNGQRLRSVAERDSSNSRLSPGMEERGWRIIVIEHQGCDCYRRTVDVNDRSRKSQMRRCEDLIRWYDKICQAGEFVSDPLFLSWMIGSTRGPRIDPRLDTWRLGSAAACQESCLVKK